MASLFGVGRKCVSRPGSPRAYFVWLRDRQDSDKVNLATITVGVPATPFVPPVMGSQSSLKRMRECQKSGSLRTTIVVLVHGCVNSTILA